MKLILSITLFYLCFTSSSFAMNQCVNKMKNAASYQHAQSLLAVVQKTRVVSFRMGSWTRELSDNSGSALVLIGFRNALNYYQVRARQIGISSFCNILSTTELDSNELDPALLRSDLYKQIIGNAYFMSESDQVWEAYYSEVKVGSDYPLEDVKKALGVGNKPVAILSHTRAVKLLNEYIFENPYEDLNEAKAYKKLKKALLEDLTELRLIRVGKEDSGEILVYLVGRRADGRLVGVSTMSVET